MNPVRVTDGSQKWKILIGLFALCSIFYFGSKTTQLGGVADSVSYGGNGVTTSTVTCANGTNTTLLAAQSGRTSAWFTNHGAVNVSFCKTSICTQTVGRVLGVSSTAHSNFEQSDGYTGIYTCVGVGGTSSVAVQSSQ